MGYIVKIGKKKCHEIAQISYLFSLIRTKKALGVENRFLATQWEGSLKRNTQNPIKLGGLHSLPETWNGSLFLLPEISDKT